MSELARNTFSYAALDPEAERIVKASAAAIKLVTSRVIPEIGRHLLAAKAALPHGAFTVWAETELGITARSARNYMSAAEWLKGKPETVADLPPTIIYALASPAADAELVTDVIGMASGGFIDVAVVREKLEAAKLDLQDLRHAQQKSPTLTMTEMRARRLKRREKLARQDEQYKQEEQNKRNALRADLQPLAESLVGLGPETVDALFTALKWPLAQLVLKELTDELLRKNKA